MKQAIVILAFLVVTGGAIPAHAETDRPEQPLPNDLIFKGDPLGQELATFKANHRRQANGNDVAPFCSDDRPKGFIVEAASEVPGETWCILYFPYEIIDKKFTPPTFAEVPTLGFEEIKAAGRPGLLYRFIALDGSGPQLWSVEVMLPHSGFEKVQTAMQAKFGSPSSQSSETLQTTFGAKFEGNVAHWESPKWRVSLFEYFGSKVVTGVFYRLKEHEGVYLQRKRQAQEKAAKDM